MISVPQTEPLATLPDRNLLWMVLAVGGYALLLASMMAVPLTIFVPAMVFFCAARYGWRAAMVAVVMTAALFVALAAVLANTPPVGPHDLAENLVFPLGRLVSVALPALLVAPLVQRGAPFGRVLLAGVVLGMASFGAMELAMWTASGVSPHAEQVKMLRGVFAEGVKSAPSFLTSVSSQRPERALEAEVYCFEAIRAIGIALAFTFSLVFFGRVQALRQFSRTHELSAPVAYTFRSLVMPEWLLFVFVAAGLSPLATGALRHVGVNVIVVVGILYLLQGLAILRWFIAAVGVSFLGAFVVYGILMMLTPISELLLSIAGLFDSFFDFRHFNRKDSTHEGHSD